MNLFAGIVVAAVGVLIAILGALRVLPYMTSAGVALLLLGALSIALSFVKRPDPEGTEKISTAATLAKIFAAPAEVFRNLRRHPRWLAAVVIMVVLSQTYSNLFYYRLTPERIANYTVDKTLELSLLTDDARSAIEKSRAETVEQAKSPAARVSQGINAFVATIFWYAFLAAIFLLLALALGGKINYWQAFSAAVYAMFPVAVIRFVLNTLILFIKDPADISPVGGQSNLVQDNLSFLFTPSASPVLYSLASSFGLLWFYWIYLNATGLNNAAERVPNFFGWAATLTVYFLLVCLVVALAFIFPSFVG